MKTSFVLSSKVINTIQALPAEERAKISMALAGDMLLGQNPRDVLTAAQMIIYTFIRFSIDRDTQRGLAMCQ
ncbi:MAG: DUF6291 domain-containing protein [Bacteroides sp.]|nr:DUF6291 domain-containing protein [Bacteroides sp.]